MKKILLTILTIILILSVNVLAVDIDIGMPAVNRTSSRVNETCVDRMNPANASGKITSIEIWANTDLSGCEVATFFVVSGNNLSTRDYEAIGTVTAGSKQTFTVDLDVQEGDYIGMTYSAGKIESDSSGGDDWNILYEDHIPCINQEFNTGSHIFSLYGTGTTAVGWSHKWNTKEISKWNTKEFTKWNDLE